MRKLLFSIAFLCAMFSNAQTATDNQSVTENDLNVVLQSINRKLEQLKGIHEDASLIRQAKDVENLNNGHEYVDLGLSVKWATMNIGATEVAGSKLNIHTGQLDCYGEYYAWGETSPKDSYNWENYNYCPNYDINSMVQTLSKYVTSSDYENIDKKVKLEFYPTCDDAARANWGSSWRMPTTKEQDELRNNCYWEWTESYNNSDAKGYIVYKVKNDSDKGVTKDNNSSTNPTASYSLTDTHIFLPASGYRKDSSFYYVGSGGDYWSSSLMSNSSYSNYAYILYYDYSIGVGWGSRLRYYGMSVRAVCP